MTKKMVVILVGVALALVALLVVQLADEPGDRSSAAISVAVVREAPSWEQLVGRTIVSQWSPAQPTRCSKGSLTPVAMLERVRGRFEDQLPGCVFRGGCENSASACQPMRDILTRFTEETAQQSQDYWVAWEVLAGRIRRFPGLKTREVEVRGGSMRFPMPEPYGIGVYETRVCLNRLLGEMTWEAGIGGYSGYDWRISVESNLGPWFSATAYPDGRWFAIDYLNREIGEWARALGQGLGGP